ncbi:hypothetical protein [Actinokineospora fastidiosa]|uniref:Uncharacterized protein n=1 Tax=Actinokineospora fastidiosa TaxID=1816 RepID=A0A918GG47_9PSEU|nr:hypothetical protein [Actinokineospora fastidiosa]GGS35399.1 hypothetical protein GCM10010171_32460 [Actinokineospora fastidiosa]
MRDPLADHPDLTDEAWIREATKRARRAARADRAPRPRRVRRRPSALVVVGVVTAMLLAGAVVFRADLFGDPVAAADRAPSGRVDRERPFVGSLAEARPDGAAGIVVPVAAPVGAYSAEEVAAAYSAVRDLLIAGRVDGRALNEGRFDALLAGLTPESREHVRKGLAGRSALAWATVIEPGVRLLPVPPKVDGAMVAKVGDGGRLVVDTDYTFAYAFDVPGALTVDEYVAMLRYQVRFTVTDTGLHPTSAEGYALAMSCAAMSRGRLAPLTPDDVTLVDPASATRIDPFDHTQPLPDTGSCRVE